MSNTTAVELTTVPLYEKDELTVVGYPTHNSKNVKIYWAGGLLASAPDLVGAVSNAYIGIRLMSPKHNEWLKTVELRNKILKHLMDMDWLIADSLSRNKDGIAKNLSLGITWHLGEDAKDQKSDPFYGYVREKHQLENGNKLKDILNYEQDLLTVSIDFKDVCFPHDSFTSVRGLAIDESFDDQITLLLQSVASNTVARHRNAWRGDTKLTRHQLYAIDSAYPACGYYNAREDFIGILASIQECWKKAKVVGDIKEPRTLLSIHDVTLEDVVRLKTEFLNSNPKKDETTVFHPKYGIKNINTELGAVVVGDGKGGTVEINMSKDELVVNTGKAGVVLVNGGITTIETDRLFVSDGFERDVPPYVQSAYNSLEKELLRVLPWLTIEKYLTKILLWDYQTVSFNEYIMSPQFFKSIGINLDKQFLETVASEYQKHKKGCKLVAETMKDMFKK